MWEVIESWALDTLLGFAFTTLGEPPVSLAVIVLAASLAAGFFFRWVPRWRLKSADLVGVLRIWVPLSVMLLGLAAANAIERHAITPVGLFYSADRNARSFALRTEVEIQKVRGHTVPVGGMTFVVEGIDRESNLIALGIDGFEMVTGTQMLNSHGYIRPRRQCYMHYMDQSNRMLVVVLDDRHESTLLGVLLLKKPGERGIYMALGEGCDRQAPSILDRFRTD
jgi:hypothetical protein